MPSSGSRNRDNVVVLASYKWSGRLRPEGPVVNGTMLAKDMHEVLARITSSHGVDWRGWDFLTLKTGSDEKVVFTHVKDSKPHVVIPVHRPPAVAKAMGPTCEGPSCSNPPPEKVEASSVSKPFENDIVTTLFGGVVVRKG